MNRVLVDSSVWIHYFSGSDNSIIEKLNSLIDINNICINDLILAELVPAIMHRKEKQLADLLKVIKKIPLTINWDEIIDIQLLNLRNGINKVGISDIIIFQNTLQNDLILFSIDKHFKLMSKYHKIRLFD